MTVRFFIFLMMSTLLSVEVHARTRSLDMDKTLLTHANLIQSIEYEILRSQARLTQLRKKLVDLEQNRMAHTKSQKAASAALMRLIRRPTNMPIVAGLDLVRGDYVVSDMQNKTMRWLKQLSERNRSIAQLTIDMQNQEQALRAELIKRRKAHQVLEKLLARNRTRTINRSWARRNQRIAQETKNASTLISEVIALKQSRDRKGKIERELLLEPGAGRLSQRFGEKNILGMHALGIHWTMLSNAHIRAPLSGQIVFAGPFRDHGKILILASPGGYHILLAGLSHLDVSVGDVVFKGQPLGVLPKKRPRPRLYLELRHHGRPINPEPFFVKDFVKPFVKPLKGLKQGKRK